MPRRLLIRLAAIAAIAAILAASAPAASADRPRSSVAHLNRALHDYLVGRDGHVTVAVDDLRTGTRVLHRRGQQQFTASIVKVEILLALLAKHHAPLQPNRAARARRMIEQSSNTDAQALWERVGRTHGLAAFDRRIGLAHTQPGTTPGPAGYTWGRTLTTPADQLRLLALIADPNPILTDRDRRYVRRLMTHIAADQRWGITAGTSSEAVVAVKNGWLLLPDGTWQINSIGWVRAKSRDYLVAVMTTGSPSMSYGVATVEHASRIVWRHLRR